MKIFKSIILYTSLLFSVVTIFSVFTFPQRAQAACELNLSDGALRFRTSQGVVNKTLIGWFNESEPPFVYVDIKTFGDCPPGSNFYLTIFGIDEDGDMETSIEDHAINAHAVQQSGGIALTFKAGEDPCYGDNSDTGEADCLVFALITDLPRSNPESKILGIIGNLIAMVSEPQAQLFLNQFNASQLDVAGQSCDTTSGYLYVNAQDCAYTAVVAFEEIFPDNTQQKLINYYNTYGGSYSITDSQISINGQNVGLLALVGGLVSFTMPALLADVNTVVQLEPGSPSFETIGLPGLLYDCSWPCEEGDWEVVANGTLPYGEIHPTDTGAVDVSPLPSYYQEDYIPLAPLPFEGLNGGPTPTLGEYLAAIFRMGIVVVVILAVIMIVFHGIALATTAAIGKKSEHKDGVKNAIFGLILAMGSWLLLNTISPQLASDLGIGIPSVTLEGDAESISTSPTTTSTGVITGLTLPTDLNLYCPLGGGSSAVPAIVDSFNNKVTYRWGGKGSDLPAGASFPMSPNESSNGQYMCNENGQSVPCRNFCPDNSVCLDCSGFVNHVRKCAGFSIYGGTSSMTQSQSAIAVDMDTLSSNGQSLNVNGVLYTLQPGDILVWNGHVVIYYGNGIIAESKGDISSIKNPNQNIKKTELAESSYRNKITHLIKANP